LKAKYKTLDGGGDSVEYEAIVPQPMTHTDGFTLLGFNSWEDVQDEKLAFAVTNVAEFYLDKEKGQVGFHENKG
jgi:hypothetical protein